ncbi:hypothetical protein LCGC14_2073590 [marine sediment metagenome]|uniref:Uncharacterized protein n=1 Tax=marine sediment metagenome TaxID=412755 RepID=A0A0F9GVZ9_9ZZZZ
MVYERKCRVDECDNEAEWELVVKRIDSNFEDYRDEFCRDHHNKIQIKFD